MRAWRVVRLLPSILGKVKGLHALHQLLTTNDDFIVKLVVYHKSVIYIYYPDEKHRVTPRLLRLESTKIDGEECRKIDIG